LSRSASDLYLDILSAIEAIESYTKIDFDKFSADPMAQDAVKLRLIEIGEAVKGIQSAGVDLVKLEPNIPWSKIAGMRDLIAHHYWKVDVDLLWRTATKSTSDLKRAVRKLRKALSIAPTPFTKRGRK
jgi:uncharacterized protein with HEPN domain